MGLQGLDLHYFITDKCLYLASHTKALLQLAPFLASASFFKISTKLEYIEGSELHSISNLYERNMRGIYV
jgi:hypothetical protein